MHSGWFHVLLELGLEFICAASQISLDCHTLRRGFVQHSAFSSTSVYVAQTSGCHKISQKDSLAVRFRPPHVNCWILNFVSFAPSGSSVFPLGFLMLWNCFWASPCHLF